MLAAAEANGWLDGDRAILETLLAFRRAGCDGILTYAAPRAARLLADSRSADGAVSLSARHLRWLHGGLPRSVRCAAQHGRYLGARGKEKPARGPRPRATPGFKRYGRRPRGDPAFAPEAEANTRGDRSWRTPFR